MALHGVDTVRIESFNDETVKVPALMDTRDKAPVVAFDEPPADTRVTITTMDGHMLSLDVNVAIPERDLELQWRELEAKFRSLVDPALGVQTRTAETGHSAHSSVIDPHGLFERHCVA